MDGNRIVACIRMMLGLFSVQLLAIAVCVQLDNIPLLLLQPCCWLQQRRFRGCGIYQLCVCVLCTLLSILCVLASSHTFSYSNILVRVLAYNSLWPAYRVAYVACFLPLLFPSLSSFTHITFIIASLDLCVCSFMVSYNYYI